MLARSQERTPLLLVTSPLQAQIPAQECLCAGYFRPHRKRKVCVALLIPLAQWPLISCRAHVAERITRLALAPPARLRVAPQWGFPIASMTGLRLNNIAPKTAHQTELVVDQASAVMTPNFVLVASAIPSSRLPMEEAGLHIAEVVLLLPAEAPRRPSPLDSVRMTQ